MRLSGVRWAYRKTVFGLSDLVGIDLPHLMESMVRTLPAEDPFHARAMIPELIGK